MTYTDIWMLIPYLILGNPIVLVVKRLYDFLIPLILGIEKVH